MNIPHSIKIRGKRKAGASSHYKGPAVSSGAFVILVIYENPLL